MNKEKLINWLEHQMYTYRTYFGLAYYGQELNSTEEFEKQYQWEISRNKMIWKTIKYIRESM